MKLADIQPQYFPRLHYFARMLECDVFVIRDDVQFVRNHRYPDGTRGVSYQAHTPIKSPQGAHLLGTSIRKGSPSSIASTQVAYDQPWDRKHRNLLATYYAGSPHRRALVPEIEALLACRFETVAELNIASTCWALCRALGIAPRIPDDLSFDRLAQLVEAERPGRLRRVALGSRLLAGTTAPDASARIAELCRITGADEYVAGGTAFSSYLDAGPFEAAGIQIRIQQWSCPSYPQQHAAAGHVANLSILDLLINAPVTRPAALLS